MLLYLLKAELRKKNALSAISRSKKVDCKLACITILKNKMKLRKKKDLQEINCGISRKDVSFLLFK